MGILCQSCNTPNNENYNSEKSDGHHHNHKGIITLPKDMVDSMNTSKNKENEKENIHKNEPEEKIFKFEHDDGNEKEGINESIEGKNISYNVFEKSKSHDIKVDDEMIGEKTEKIIERKKKKSEQNKDKNQYINKTVKEHLKIENIKNKIIASKEISNDFKMNSRKSDIFQRRSKKSTTLKGNSKLLQQFFLAEMKIPISHELLVPQNKGNPNEKYIRGKKIGKGTFGIVYESKNLIFNNKVAMKVIPKNEKMNNTFIQNEIDILKKLSHPNIVRIYEFYESYNCFYLINEYCSGGELFEYINNSKLNEQQLASIFYQVFSGLKYLHENNILHRDLKPENILIFKKETDLVDKQEYFWIKIIDFGTAKIFRNDKNEDKVVGSPYYIAPEVLNKDYNEKCDTWSIGVILYMFLVGRPPFDGQNNAEIIHSIRHKNYDKNNPKLLTHSPEVRDLISHLLEKDNNKRFSAKEALNHIWFKKFNGRKLFGNFEEKDIQPFIDNLFNYSFTSKIQPLVIAFLVHNLPSTESCHIILKLYRYLNEAGDCKLTKDELIKGLKKYRNIDEIEQKVDNLFKILDADINGFIEYEEFLRACIDKKELFNDAYLKYAFKFLDKNNTNVLSSEQIISSFLVKKKKNELFELSITNAINEVDEDGDGKINFEEFKRLMLKSMN